MPAKSPDLCDSMFTHDGLVTGSRSLAVILSVRWEEAKAALPDLGFVEPTWEITPRSPHFESPRGFAVTVVDGSYYHIKLAPRIVGQPLHRVDALVRHEIGHIIDFAGVSLPPGLPSTPERRADAIAEHVWREAMYYDVDLVQSLLPGTRPRPAHLGL